MMQLPPVENNDRAQQVKMIMYMILGLMAVEALFLAREIDLLNTLEVNESLISEQELEWHNLLSGSVGGMQVLLMTTAAVLFVRWMARAHRNYQRAGGQTAYTTTGVQWAFFIPFVNLWRPYQVVKEFWEGFQERLAYFKEEPAWVSTTLIGWWWGCWITTNGLAYISVRLYQEATDFKTLALSNTVELTSLAFQIPATLLVVSMMTRYQAIEEELKALYQIQQLEARPTEDDAAYEQPIN